MGPVLPGVTLKGRKVHGQIREGVWCVSAVGYLGAAVRTRACVCVCECVSVAAARLPSPGGVQSCG